MKSKHLSPSMKKPLPKQPANLLKRMRLYTIGPMEYAEGRSWREQVKKELKSRKITVFDPYHKPFIEEVPEDEKARKELKKWQHQGRLDRVHARMKIVRKDDLRICDLSDFFIAYIIPGVASWGSSEELVTANRMKKPIFVWVEGGRNLCPLWVLGMFSPKYIHDSLEDVLKMIKDIDDGTLTIDSDRWRLLKKEYR